MYWGRRSGALGVYKYGIHLTPSLAEVSPKLLS